MSRQTSPAFSLKAGAYAAEALSVSALSGTEGLGRLFDFRVQFFPKDGEPLVSADIVGQDALLAVAVREGAVRHVHGWVRGLESLGMVNGRRRYRLLVVPKLWRQTQTVRSRIFQHKAVPDILKAVLKEAGVDFRLSLHGSYAEREYCVQYRESDFAFLSRLMEWEGLYYFFEHTEDTHTLVVMDRPEAHAALPDGAVLPVREEGARAHDEEFVSHLERVHRLRPGAVHLKDYDFEKPSLDVSGKSKASEGLAALELYDYPAGYVTPGEGKAAARARLEAAKVGGLTVAGTSVAPRLTPGYLLEVDSPGDGTFAGEYLITEVVHDGRHPDVFAGGEALQGLYRNHFQLLPKGTPFRPRRTTPVPNIAGPQTATVTGPAGEEIHTDAHGRIKVQFHWDREGKKDDKSSCWVRVGQPWGGPAWGDVWLPRIGQEVVVRFLEGDPDRPLVAGAVYNGANAVPYALPDEKTKSTRKSASSLGSNGFNEVRVEDAAGAEEVFTHAQKDEDLLTENDKVQEVRGYEDLLVKKDRKRTVEGHQQLLVMKDDVGVVEGNQTLLVQKNRDTTTAGSHDESVEGNQAMTVGGNLTGLVVQGAMENVGAAKATTIGGGYSVNVALAFNEATGAARLMQIGGLHVEYVAGSRQETVAKDKQAKVGADWQVEVDGQVQLTVGKDDTQNVQKEALLQVKEEVGWLAQKFELKADTYKLVVNDKLILSIEKNGNVKLSANTLTLDGSDIKFKGAKVKLEAAGSLKSGSGKKPEIAALAKQTPKGSVRVQARSTGGESLEGKTVELKMADGSTKKGTFDASGAVLVEDVKPGPLTVSFPDLKSGA
jgi:type VI secretion system secreted protein VgrG